MKTLFDRVRALGSQTVVEAGGKYKNISGEIYELARDLRLKGSEKFPIKAGFMIRYSNGKETRIFLREHKDDEFIPSQELGLYKK